MLTVDTTGQGSTTAGHLGSITDILNGHVAEHIGKMRLSASDFLCGFEGATPDSLASLGESVIVNGICYATSTDPTSPSYEQLIYGDSFTPGGVFMLPKDALPSHTAQQAQGEVALDQLYQQLIHAVQAPFAFCGKMLMKKLHAIYITKAPISEQPIFDNTELYFAKPHIYREDVWCYAIGVISTDIRAAHVDKVLYQNPFDEKKSIIHHTHTLTLKSNGPVVPDNVDQCLHLFSEESIVEEADLKIYTIKNVESIETWKEVALKS